MNPRKLILENQCLTLAGWLGWSIVLYTNCCGFNPRSEHTPRFQVWSWLGRTWEATNWLTDVSLFSSLLFSSLLFSSLLFSLSLCLFLPSSLSQINKHILRWGLKENQCLLKRRPAFWDTNKKVSPICYLKDSISSCKVHLSPLALSSLPHAVCSVLSACYFPLSHNASASRTLTSARQDALPRALSCTAAPWASTLISRVPKHTGGSKSLFLLSIPFPGAS